MSTNKTASNKTASNKTAENNNKKVLPIGRKLSESDIQALEARLAAAEAINKQLEADKAALEAKVKTSSKREPKLPDVYDILQPVFVSLRGNIGKGIAPDITLIDIFKHAASVLIVDLTADIQKKLFEKTVLHNSTSNIAKADSIKSAEGRKAAFEEMLKQAIVMLPAITESEWAAYKAAYKAAYDKAVSKLK
jgi:multidrug resistance efflux pump